MKERPYRENVDENTILRSRFLNLEGFNGQGTINDFKNKKYQSIYNQLLLLQKNLPETSIVRLYDNTPEGLKSLAEKKNQSNLLPEIKKIFVNEHTGDNKKVIDVAGKNYYSPYISTTKNLPIFVDTTFSPQGDTNLRHDVFHRSPTIGIFNNIPPGYLQDMSTVIQSNPLPQLEQEVLFDSDNTDKQTLANFLISSGPNPFQGNMDIDLRKLFKSRMMQPIPKISRYYTAMAQIPKNIKLNANQLKIFKEAQELNKELQTQGFSQNPPLPFPKKYDSDFKVIPNNSNDSNLNISNLPSINNRQTLRNLNQQTNNLVNSNESHIIDLSHDVLGTTNYIPKATHNSSDPNYGKDNLGNVHKNTNKRILNSNNKLNHQLDDQYNTEEYDDSYMSYGNAYDDDGQQSNFREGGVVDINSQALPRLADLISRYGRNGDTELAHINPIEAHILKSLGGSGTINPVTGLPEYFFRGVRNFIKNPGKTINKSFRNPRAIMRTAADIASTAAAIYGGPVGGAIGGGLRAVVRKENPLIGALKGAGYGTAAPMAANLAGQGLSALGANSLGSSLQNYATSNMGSWFGNMAQAGEGVRGLGSSLGFGNPMNLFGNSSGISAGNVASYSPYSVLSQGMGRGGGQGLGVSGGDYAENYYNYMLDRQKKQDNMGFTDKLQDYLTEPKNLLTLGTTAAQYAGRQKPKSPEKIAEEERRYRNASRKTIAEIEADEALETARSDLKKKKKNKRLEEDINNMGRVNRRVVSPEEFARTGRWFEYTDDVGNPVRMKGGGLMHSPYAYLMEERYYPRSSDGYLDGDTGGQDDLIDARLSDGEYVLDASTVSDLGDGNNSAGARKLDNFRRNIREHKRGGKVTLPPRAKSLENYLRG